MHGTVLVTGGSGFIGSHVVDRLRVAGYTPRIFDCRPSPWHDDVQTVIGDLLRADDVLAAARGCVGICHLGAAADVGEVFKHPGPATVLNTTGTLNVLEAARELDIKRVVYASTVWVYSDVEADVVDEDTLLPPPAHLYTAGKLSGELLCHSYAELYKLEPTILRFGIPYGPRARPAAVIPQFVDKAVRGIPLSIAGSGDQERAFVYVEDLAEGVVRGLQPEAAGRIYNLAGDEITTIRGLADIVNETVAPVEVLHTDGRAGDLKGSTISNARATSELGWSASTPLRDGVQAYAAWLKAQPEAEAAAVSSAPATPTRPSLMSRLVTLTNDPTFVCLASLVAVLSATIATVLGAPETAQSVSFTLVGVCVLLPLLPLLLVTWPVERRRAQAATAASLAAAGVIALGLTSSDGDIHLGPTQVLLLLVASATATSLTSAAPMLAQRSA
jgi:UDP-glucose 4-epimerase